AAMKVAQLRGAPEFLASGRARDLACTRRQRLEYRIEMLHGLLGAADHHAVTALKPPDTATGSGVHILDVLRRELTGTPDVVHIIGVASVDEDIAAFKVWHKAGNGAVNGRSGDHQPYRTRSLQFTCHVFKRGGSRGALLYKRLFRLRRHIENHASVAVLKEPPHHVGAHSA